MFSKSAEDTRRIFNKGILLVIATAALHGVLLIQQTMLPELGTLDNGLLVLYLTKLE